MLYRLAQAGKVIERHSREHVMFNMILHVPIEKGWQPTTCVSSGAKSKIGSVGRESDMLRHRA